MGSGWSVSVSGLLTGWFIDEWVIVAWVEDAFFFLCEWHRTEYQDHIAAADRVWVLTLGRFITVEQTSDLDPELHREWI